MQYKHGMYNYRNIIYSETMLTLLSKVKIMQLSYWLRCNLISVLTRFKLMVVILSFGCSSRERRYDDIASAYLPFKCRIAPRFEWYSASCKEISSLIHFSCHDSTNFNTVVYRRAVTNRGLKLVQN
jgi:hypothetical protein